MPIVVEMVDGVDGFGAWVWTGLQATPPDVNPVQPTTDTSNSFNGLVISGGEAIVTYSIPVAPVPADMTLGYRVDKSLPYPTPVMVNGRPT